MKGGPQSSSVSNPAAMPSNRPPRHWLAAEVRAASGDFGPEGRWCRGSGGWNKEFMVNFMKKAMRLWLLRLLSLLIIYCLLFFLCVLMCVVLDLFGSGSKLINAATLIDPAFIFNLSIPIILYVLTIPIIIRRRTKLIPFKSTIQYSPPDWNKKIKIHLSEGFKNTDYRTAMTDLNELLEQLISEKNNGKVIVFRTHIEINIKKEIGKIIIGKFKFDSKKNSIKGFLLLCYMAFCLSWGRQVKGVADYAIHRGVKKVLWDEKYKENMAILWKKEIKVP